MDRVHSFLIAAAAAAAVVVIITRVFAGEPREYRDKRDEMKYRKRASFEITDEFIRRQSIATIARSILRPAR